MAFVTACLGAVGSVRMSPPVLTTCGMHPGVLLQDAGLLISRKDHGSHHRSPFTAKYSIVSGWVNPWMDRDCPGALAAPAVALLRLLSGWLCSDAWHEPYVCRARGSVWECSSPLWLDARASLLSLSLCIISPACTGGAPAHSPSLRPLPACRELCVAPVGAVHSRAHRGGASLLARAGLLLDRAGAAHSLKGTALLGQASLKLLLGWRVPVEG